MWAEDNSGRQEQKTNSTPVVQIGLSDQMVSASSVLEIELKEKMFLNRLTHTYMRTVSSHTIEKIWTFGGGIPPKEKI